MCVWGGGGSQDDSSFRLWMESLFDGSVTDTKNVKPNSNDVYVYVKKTYFFLFIIFSLKPPLEYIVSNLMHLLYVPFDQV